MQLQDIKIGDVLLFSAQKDSAISWMISWLTEASVSHAGIYYDAEKYLLIDQTPPQIAIHNIQASSRNRTIYVYRHDSSLPMEPVINAATHYLNNEEPYDMAELYLIGLLLIYRKASFSHKAQKMVTLILKKLTASIVEGIHKYKNLRKNQGEHPMVCSQFVAQCFEDAGSAYKLRFKGSILNSYSGQPGGAAEKTPLEKAIDAHTHSTQAISAFPQQDEIHHSAEKLCQMFQETITAAEVSATSTQDSELSDTIAQFILAHHHESEQTALLATPQFRLQAMQQFNTDLNMYVFPGDLMNHCLSLKSVGNIEC